MSMLQTIHESKRSATISKPVSERIAKMVNKELEEKAKIKTLYQNWFLVQESEYKKCYTRMN